MRNQTEHYNRSSGRTQSWFRSVSRVNNVQSCHSVGGLVVRRDLAVYRDVRRMTKDTYEVVVVNDDVSPTSRKRVVRCFVDKLRRSTRDFAKPTCTAIIWRRWEYERTMDRDNVGVEMCFDDRALSTTQRQQRRIRHINSPWAVKLSWQHSYICIF